MQRRYILFSVLFPNQIHFGSEKIHLKMCRIFINGEMKSDCGFSLPIMASQTLWQKLTECQKTFCHECMFYQDGHFARMDILSGWTFCQDGRFVRKRHFVRRTCCQDCIFKARPKHKHLITTNNRQ